MKYAKAYLICALLAGILCIAGLIISIIKGRVFTLNTLMLLGILLGSLGMIKSARQKR